jgi:hypothetical protein
MIELLVAPPLGIACLVLAVLACGGAMMLSELTPASQAGRWATAGGLALVCLSLALVFARFAVVAA